MKKIITNLLIFSLFLGAIFCLGSCGNKVNYDNYEKYAPGDWAQTVLITGIDIEWLSGRVEILPHEYGYVAVTESSESEIIGGVAMHSYYDGATLRIKPCASGTGANAVPEKTLTVYVPFGYSFSDIDINTGSADVKIEDAGANFIEVNTGSGNVELNIEGKSQEIDVNTASGEVKLNAEASRSVEIETASGNIIVENRIMPAELEISSLSGNVICYLPEDAGFTLECATASGKINNSFTVTESGGNKVVGNGVADVEITTASGDVTIDKK